eukprot:scaffold5244_cov61-Phaeocystis_antarctica.AAC.5
MANSPPGAKGSWRRPDAAAATTKAPYKFRAAKHEAAGAKPAVPSTTPHSFDRQFKEQRQPGAADASENARQRRTAKRAANHAAAAPAANSRRHCRRCRRTSQAPRSPTRLRLRSDRLWLCHQEWRQASPGPQQAKGDILGEW